MEMMADYKRTDLSMIPADWSVQQLTEVLDFISGKAHEQFIVPYGRYIAVNSKFISSEGRIAKFSDQAFCRARSNDILMVMSDLPNGKTLAKCFLVKIDEKYTVNQRVCILRAKKGCAEFFFFQLNRNPYFLAFDDGVQQTHLLNGVFRACPVIVPASLDEQRAIAEALSDVDALLGALDRLIAKRRDLKQAAMQQLLSGQTRLPGFSGEWEVKALGRIAPLQRGFDLPGAQLRPGPFPVVYSNGIMNYHNVALVRGPGVVTGRSGTIGRVSYVQDDFWPHNTALWVKNFNGNDPKFIYYLYLHVDLGRFESGSGVPTLNRNDVHSEHVSLPSGVGEQSAIATVLSDMDAELEALKQRRAKTAALKQGMMQELLTGRTRLV